MGNIILTIIGILVGAGLAGCGIYYLVRERENKSLRKVYGMFIAIGAVILAGLIIKIIVAGF